MGTNPIRLPPGFTLDEQSGEEAQLQPKPPPGFRVDQQAPPEAPKEDEESWLGSAWEFAKGFGHTVNPMPALKSLYEVSLPFGQRTTQLKKAKTAYREGRYSEAAGHTVAGMFPSTAATGEMIKAATKSQITQFEKAKKAYDEGRYSEAAGYTVAGVFPLLGPAAAGAGETIGSGEVARGLGETAGILSPVALNRMRLAKGRVPKGGPPITGDLRGGAPPKPWRFVKKEAGRAARMAIPKIKGPPETLLTRAVKPGKNNVRWGQDLREAMPHMKAAEKVMKRPIVNLDDAIEATKIAKERLWGRYEIKLTAHQSATIDGNRVASSMLRSVPQRVRIQNPGLMEKLREKAGTYRRELTLAETEDFLQSVNKELEFFYRKEKVSRATARNSPQLGPVVAEGDALRRELYAKLDELSGPGAKQLKREYGALSNIERELIGRKNVFERQQPQGLAEQIGFARGGARIAWATAKGDIPGALRGAQEITLSRWLKHRQSSDNLIKTAFGKYRATEFIEIPKPVPFAPSGLLTEGNIRLGAIPSHSRVIGLKPRRGVVRDPKTGRMKRYYKGF